MIPNAGNHLPQARRFSQAAYSQMIGEALRLELGGSGKATKTLMKWTGANERTARNWLSGTIGPSGKHLILLFKESDAVLHAVMQASDRHSDLALVRLGEIADTLVDELAAIYATLQAKA